MNQVLRYGGVGLATTALHLIVALGSHEAGGMEPQAANLAGFLTAALVNYVGNSRWTFEAQGADAVYLPRFFLLCAIALLTSAFVTAGVVAADFPYWVAVLSVGLTVPPMTFLGSKFMVFTPSTDGAAFALPLGLLATALVWIVFSGHMLNHDTSWYLVSTRKWLDGATLYRDIVEVNPPLGFYLTLPALGLAEAFNLSDSDGQVALIAGLTGVSVGWAAHILAKDWSVGRAAIFASAMGLAVTLPFGAHFAQREHILVLCLLPWVSEALTGRTSARTSALAAVGICLKPFFLMYPLALTAVWCWQSRSPRPLLSRSNLTIGALGAAYLAVSLVLHPEYFHTILPAASVTYGAYGADDATVIGNAHLPLALLAVVTFAFNRNAPGVPIVMATLIAALSAYAMQWTGFTYQSGPVFAFALIVLAFAATREAAGLPTLAIAGAGALLAGGLVWETGRYHNDIARLVGPEVLSRYGEGARMAAWSTSLEPAFPLTLVAKGQWMPNGPALWYLPATMTTCKSEECAALLEQTRAQMLRHVTGDCSDVLIVDRQMPYLHEAGIGLDDIIDGDPRYGTALEHYDRIAGDTRFDILFRSDEAPSC